MMGRKRKPSSGAFRCPACGQRITTSSTLRCPMCDFAFPDDRVTGTDVTPYAHARAKQTRGWWRMLEWVWYTGTGRVKHLALMRRSAASRRFARLNLLLLAVAAALLRQTMVGWRWVTASPALEQTASVLPSGRGWFHVAARPRPLPTDLPTEVYTDLWWNAGQALLEIMAAFAGALLLLWLGLVLMRVGISMAHTASYRGEKRMTAALHYGTAWAIPIAFGALVAALRPIGYIGAMASWAWYPPDRVFVLSASVLSGFGAVMGWYWLVRLGTAAPARTRTRVVSFFVLGLPLIATAASVAWWWGLEESLPPLFSALKLSF